MPRKHKSRIQELESELKQLKKESGRHAKKAKRLENMVDSFTTEDEELEKQFAKAPAKSKCPECASSDFEIADLVLKDLHRCYECGYHRTFAKAKPKEGK
jgi:phage shock protein A